MDSESSDPLCLLQKNLNGDDSGQAIARLSIIALALGPLRTRDELIPFLEKNWKNISNEAQTALADQLSRFVNLVGGPIYVVILLPLLEKLAGEENSSVRTTAMNSLVKLVPRMEKEDVAPHFFPLLLRLTKGNHLTKLSACGLFSVTYSLVNKKMQEKIRNLYIGLCDDDISIVREIAYQNLPKLCLVVPKSHFKSDFYDIVKDLSKNGIHSTRIYSLKCCTQLVFKKKLDSNDFLQYLLPLITTFQGDESSHVRKALAEDMVTLSENLPDDIFSKYLLPLFAKLLKDKSADVRAEAATHLHKVCASVKTGLQEHIIPALETLADDGKDKVRIAFSKSLLRLCVSLGSNSSFAKGTVQNLLFPIIQSLVKDEKFEVRSNIVNDLGILSKAIGSNSLVNDLLPSLITLATDETWRIRYAIVSKWSLLSEELKVDVFEKKLQQLVIAGLNDQVFVIREECCLQIGQIVKIFGGEWASKELFSRAFILYDKGPNYQHRLTCLSLITNVIKHANIRSGIIDQYLFPLIQKATNDKVPNVRIAAAKTMDIVLSSEKLDKNVSEAKIIPALQKLTTDSDVDVIFYAEQALSNCQYEKKQ